MDTFWNPKPKKLNMQVLTKYLFTFFFLYISFQSISQVEYRQYAIKVVGIKVGELIATKSLSKDSVSEYTLKSLVDVNFLVYHLKVDYSVKSMLKGSSMMYSEVNVESNRGNFNTKTERTIEGYTLKSKQPKKEIEKILKASINHTFSSIHFHEPVGVSEVYAEFYGDFIQIKPSGSHKYSGVLDDNEDEFYYKNGLLVKAVKKNRITDMVIVLEKSWVEQL